MHFRSPAVAGSVHLPRKEAAHNYKFLSEGAQRAKAAVDGPVEKTHIYS